MLKKLLVSLFLCSAVTVNAQHVLDSLQIDGRYRVFASNPSLKVKPGASLVFVMHGSGGEPMGFARRGAKLESLAEKENIVVVYTSGTGMNAGKLRRRPPMSRI